MLLLIGARCARCGTPVTEYTANTVIEWPQNAPPEKPPRIYMQCKNTVPCIMRLTQEERTAGYGPDAGQHQHERDRKSDH